MDKILLVPNPFLRQKAKNLKTVTSNDIDLSKKMIDIMLKAPGVGLAANQVSVLKKIVTVNIHNEEKGTDNIYALFNPQIKSYSKKKISRKIIVYLFFLSVFLEFTHLINPERGFEIKDLGGNIVGVVISLFIFLIFKFRKKIE